jgi:hypothetical protein
MKSSSKGNGAAHYSINKSMLTIVWNPSSFHFINVLSKGFKFNANHYGTNILDSLADWRTVQSLGSNRTLIIDADQASLHVAMMMQQFPEHKAMKRDPHPADSSNLAPSDLYLLRPTKELLAEQEFPDEEDLSERSTRFWGD